MRDQNEQINHLIYLKRHIDLTNVVLPIDPRMMCTFISKWSNLVITHSSSYIPSIEITMNFEPKVGLNMLPMSRAYHNRSFPLTLALKKQ